MSRGASPANCRENHRVRFLGELPDVVPVVGADYLGHVSAFFMCGRAVKCVRVLYE
jgi:hypothetical protein